ncbi:MAG: hypothetical protein ACI9JY_002248 [Saprospiraceae bacterium]|jgi:hypothetical protein
MQYRNIIFTILFILTLIWVGSCTQDPTEPESNNPPFVDFSCIPQDGFPATASVYAEMVESELGIVPKVFLDSMVEIPLYQNGIQVYGVFSSNEIDNPNRFGKLTVSHSALQRYEGRTESGVPLPDVVWVAFLRNSTENVNTIFGSVQIIGYNRVTGATAFFESQDNIGDFVTSIDPVTFKLSGEIPGPENPTTFNQAFRTSPNCNSCHQADPFITDPFINAAKIPGTNESVVPHLDANAPYYVIGGYNWDMRTIHIEGNQCMSCHRVGLSTARLFEENGYDVNAHMPPNNPGSLSDDYIELLEAWMNGPENTLGAEWRIPPACNEPARTVGEDYPYKEKFNDY